MLLIGKHQDGKKTEKNMEYYELDSDSLWIEIEKIISERENYFNIYDVEKKINELDLNIEFIENIEGFIHRNLNDNFPRFISLNDKGDYKKNISINLISGDWKDHESKLMVEIFIFLLRYYQTNNEYLSRRYILDFIALHGVSRKRSSLSSKFIDIQSGFMEFTGSSSPYPTMKTNTKIPSKNAFEMVGKFMNSNELVTRKNILVKQINDKDRKNLLSNNYFSYENKTSNLNNAKNFIFFLDNKKEIIIGNIKKIESINSFEKIYFNFFLSYECNKDILDNLKEIEGEISSAEILLDIFHYLSNESPYLENYDEAKNLAISIKFTSPSEYTKSPKNGGRRPSVLPWNPKEVYKDEWNGWLEFLGIRRKNAQYFITEEDIYNHIIGYFGLGDFIYENKKENFDYTNPFGLIEIKDLCIFDEENLDQIPEFIELDINKNYHSHYDQYDSDYLDELSSPDLKYNYEINQNKSTNHNEKFLKANEEFWNKTKNNRKEIRWSKDTFWNIDNNDKFQKIQDDYFTKNKKHILRFTSKYSKNYESNKNIISKKSTKINCDYELMEKSKIEELLYKKHFKENDSSRDSLIYKEWLKLTTKDKLINELNKI